MHRVKTLAAAAMMAVAMIGPSAMAASAPGQPAILHLVRGGGHAGGFGGDGGGFGGHGGFIGGPGGGFSGGYFARGGWGYRPLGYGYGIGVSPYDYGCPYPYSYTYCTFPD